MEIGIVGLPLSGATTLFNALTRGHAAVTSQARQANVGVVKVPDQRLDSLAKMFRPRRVVPAEVTYVDIPGAPEGLGRSAGIGGEYLNRLQRALALLLVVRSFENPSVPHLEGALDPYRDLGTMEMELTFSDLAILERRLKRLEDGLKGAKPQEREAIRREQESLNEIRTELERGIPIRGQSIPPQGRAMLENYQFLTAKPLLVALNIDEEDLDKAPVLEEELKSKLKGSHTRGLAICGRLESELAQMDPEEEREFRESMGAGESGLESMLRLSYEALGIVSFFTVGEDEVRAWSIQKDTIAVKAAGKIHSDMERGFIRAEVVPYEELLQCGSLTEARRKGTLRTEGKTYTVQDGDVVHFLFNV